jgi:DNA recombination protein RmuC
MTIEATAIAVLIGVATGGVIVYAVFRERLAHAQALLAAANARNEQIGELHLSGIETIAERLKGDLHNANAQIAQMQREQFLELANQRFTASEERANKSLSELVLPVQQKLGEFDAYVRQLERHRVGAQEGLKEQISGLLLRTDKLETAATNLTSQTSSLVSALRNPTTRGKWGEMQLRRVVELAGMEPYCDFSEQQSFDDEEGMSRPDLTVSLPGNSVIFVDAKAPLQAYLDAIDTKDEAARAERLRAHAAAVKLHVDQLAKKNYQRANDSADFVVLFIPGEAFLSAACIENPELIEYAAAKNVYIASPLTLIALLRSYALGWQHRRQEENAKQIAEVGRELYERVRVFTSHLSAIGASLHKAVGSYNSAVGSMESRLLPQGRKLKEVASLPDAELPDMHAVETAPRIITALDAGPREKRTPRAPQLFNNDTEVG